MKVIQKGSWWVRTDPVAGCWLAAHDPRVTLSLSYVTRFVRRGRRTTSDSHPSHDLSDRKARLSRGPTIRIDALEPSTPENTDPTSRAWAATNIDSDRDSPGRSVQRERHRTASDLA